MGMAVHFPCRRKEGLGGMGVFSGIISNFGEEIGHSRGADPTIGLSIF
jgi:hypothetical protein